MLNSGTTGIACKNTNRKFIGIEMDDKYFKIAQERINNNKIKQVVPTGELFTSEWGLV
jgi:DNA modification methylase